MVKKIDIRFINCKPIAVNEEKLTDCEFNYKERIIEKLKKFALEVGETDGIVHVEFDNNIILNIWFSEMGVNMQSEACKALGEV